MTENTEQTVLVVEDEQPLARAIRTKLEQAGFAVVAARSVAQAKEYLEEIDTIRAIWLDHYLLGDESGLDFVTRLKEEGGMHRTVPIFLVSNTASSDKVQSYLRFGVSKYYTKADYRLDDILEDIKNFLRDGERE